MSQSTDCPQSRPQWPLRKLRGISLVSAAMLLTIGCSATHAEVTEADRIIDVLGLTEDMVVADVGAGDGEWAIELARAVGPSGHVFATEVEQEDLETIREAMESAGVEHFTTLLGGQQETGLPEQCCDAVLLRLVYHHFEQPAAMRASLARALRPGARLVVVDIRPQSDWRELPGVPDRGGHGITEDGLIAEMAEDGFSVVERIDDWPGDEGRFCVVFRRD